MSSLAEQQIAAAEAIVAAARAGKEAAYNRYLETGSLEASDPARQGAQAAYFRSLSTLQLEEQNYATASANARGVSQGGGGGSGPLGVSKTYGSALSSYQQPTPDASGGTTHTPTTQIGTADQVGFTPTGSGNLSSTQRVETAISQGSLPKPITSVDKDLPGASMFNLGVTALNAARQPGATQASVKTAVSDYNQYSQQMYNPMEGNVIKAKYVPEGKYAQQERLRVKEGVAFDSQGRSTGEVAWYQEIGGGRMVRDVNTGELTTWMLIGGASRNAAQSGTIGFAAATPLVYEQGGVGTGKITKAQVYAPGVLESGITADQILASIAAGTARDIFSGLGAEAYGGKVSRLDGRTLGTTTYEDVSNRAAWNLASYVNPTDVNLPKSELPGVNIPWSVPASAPALFALTTEGGVGKPLAVKSFLANVRTGPVQEAPRNTLIIGGAEGTRYGPSIVPAAGAASPQATATTTPAIVPSTQVKGSSVGIIPTSPAGVEIGMAEGSIKKPFVSGEIIQPTGAVGIPFTDIKFTIPVVSGALAFFEGSQFVSGIPSEVRDVKFSSMRGAEATRMFIDPETQKPTRELTTAVGAPVITERVNPTTGKTETVTMQNYQTTVLPESQTVATYESKPIRSGYEQFLDAEVRPRLPDVKSTEMAIAGSQLANPFNPTENIGAVTGRSIALKGMDALGLDTKGARESGDIVTSVVSPTKGQYEFFYENPAASVGSFASMGIAGGVTRGAVAVLGRTSTGAKVIAKASPILEKYGGPVLGSLYGGMISYEETKGFKEVTPQTVARIKARGYQEGIPGAVGFGMGYDAPSAVSNTIAQSNIGYKSALQEGLTTGRVDYYVKQPVSRPIETARIDYISLKQEGYISGPIDYVSIKTTRPAVNALKARIQEFGQPAPVKGIETGYTSQSKSKPTSMPPSPKESRITSKVVGGKTVSGLKAERSIGRTIQDSPIESTGTKTSIGSRTDYRNLPQGKEAPYSKMQSQSNIVMSERLPQVEGMTQGVRQQSQQRSQSQMLMPQEMMRPELMSQQVVQPQLVSQQTTRSFAAIPLGQGFESKVELDVVQAQLQDVNNFVVISQARKQMFEVKQRQQQESASSQINRVKSTSAQEIKQIQAQRTTPISAQREASIPISRSDIASRSALDTTRSTSERTTTKPRTTEIVRQKETPIITQKVKPPVPPVPPIPGIGIPLGLPSGSPAGSAIGTRGRAYSERFQVGSGDIGWIGITGCKAPQQRPAAKPAQRASVAKTPSMRPLPPPTQKKPRKLKF